MENKIKAGKKYTIAAKTIEGRKVMMPIVAAVGDTSYSLSFKAQMAYDALSPNAKTLLDANLAKNRARKDTLIIDLTEAYFRSIAPKN